MLPCVAALRREKKSTSHKLQGFLIYSEINKPKGLKKMWQKFVSRKCEWQNTSILVFFTQFLSVRDFGLFSSGIVLLPQGNKLKNTLRQLFGKCFI